MRPIIYFILALVLVNTALATHLDTMKIEDRVIEEGIRETVLLTIADNDAESYPITLPSKAKDIISNGVPVGVNSFEIPLDCLKCEIEISYTLPGAVLKEGKDSVFTRTITNPTPQTLIYSVYLPIGAIVSDADGSITPRPSRMTSDGRNIIIEWIDDSPTLPEAFFVRYNMHKPNTHWLPFILAIVGTGVAVGIYYQRKNKRQVCEIPKSIFTTDEQEILKVIVDHEKNKPKDEIKQKEITQRLEWSKSKVSSLLTGLEQKSVIKREKYGRNHKVSITDEYKGKL